MDDELRAGKNIKTLRKNHDQNQQQVADTFHVDRSSITYIEKCSGNGISEAKLKSFESYYMTSTSEILYVDLPRIENAHADRTAMYSRIEAYFPYVASKDAMKNRMFKRACFGHKKIYDGIKKGDFTGFREIPQFLNMYKTAYEDSRSSNESAVNHTALFYLYAAITDITSHILMGRPASFSKGYETTDIDKRTFIPDDIIREMESVAGFLRSTTLPIKNAQFRLVSSLDAKLLAVKSVTSRNARAGIDHMKWKTPNEKMHAALSLTSRDYHAKPARILEKMDKGKLRHFHIDTYHDRAMQALYGYSLAPVAETRSDRKSFANRKFRSPLDVYHFITKLYSGEDAPQWAFKTDIQKCYESIDHDWIRKHIPLAEHVLDEFLRAGYFLSDKYYESDEGIGIGSRLSPYLANMSMDGLQDYIYARLNPGMRDDLIDYDNGNMIRFADDILISARNEETAREIKQIVTDFMRERNLRLSDEKTEIVHIPNGFEFMKRVYRKNGVFLNASPSETAITAFRNKIDKLLNGYTGSQARLIDEVNRKVIGFVTNHKMTDAMATFKDLDIFISLKLFELCKRRCPTWSNERIRQEFWLSDDKGRQTYALKNSPQKHVLFMADTIMTRYYPVPLRLNPYIDYEEMEDIQAEREIENVSGEYKKIWKRQDGLCEYCRRPILPDEEKEVVEVNPSESGIVGRMAYIHSRCRQLVIEYEDYEEPEYKEEDASKNLVVSLSDEYAVDDVKSHPLYLYFKEQEKKTVTLSFKKLGEIIGKPLSELAHTREFWFEDADDKLCRCWLDNSFYVKRVSTEGRRSVTFHKYRFTAGTAKVKIPDLLIHGEVPIRMKYEIEAMLKHIFEHNGIPWE